MKNELVHLTLQRQQKVGRVFLQPSTSVFGPIAALFGAGMDPADNCGLEVGWCISDASRHILRPLALGLQAEWLAAAQCCAICANAAEHGILQPPCSTGVQRYEHC